MVMCHFISQECTLHVDKRFKIANITHALPIPVHWQTHFTPKWMVVSHLHDAVAKFHTRMNSCRGDLCGHDICGGMM